MNAISIVNDLTGEAQVEFEGQSYSLCFDTAAVMHLEKVSNGRPALEVVLTDLLSVTDCIRLLCIGSAGARRGLRGAGGVIDAKVAQAMVEDFGPMRLSEPLRTSLSFARVLHLHDQPAKADEDEAVSDPLAGLPG